MAIDCDPWKPGGYLYERNERAKEQARERADLEFRAKVMAGSGDSSLARHLGVPVFVPKIKA